MRVTVITFNPIEFNVGKYAFKGHISMGETNWIKIKIKDTSKPFFQRTIFKESKIILMFTNRDSAYTKLEAKFVDALEKIEDLENSIKKEIILAIRQYFMYNIHRF